MMLVSTLDHNVKLETLIISEPTTEKRRENIPYTSFRIWIFSVILQYMRFKTIRIRRIRTEIRR